MVPCFTQHLIHLVSFRFTEEKTKGINGPFPVRITVICVCEICDNSVMHGKFMVQIITFFVCV